MGQSNWNEEKIIQTLRDFPVVEDRQTKEELFEKIESRIETKKTKRKSFKFMPILAAACVLLIAAIISPAVLKETVFKSPGSDVKHSLHGSSEIGKESPLIKKTPEEPMPPAADPEEREPQPAEQPAESKIEPKAYESNDVTYHSAAVEVPEDKQAIIVYYTDEEAENVVPVSYLADKGLPKIEALREAFQKIDTEEIGLFATEFHKGDRVKVSDDPEKNELILDIEPGTIQGSTGERMFMDTVDHTAYSLGYKQVVFRTNGEPGYEFSHFGPKETVDIKGPEKGFNTLFTEKGILLLGERIKANDSQEPTSLEGIVKSMKIDTSGFGDEEAIQPNFFIKQIREKDKTAIVELVEGSRLENNMVYMAMIESILLTAHQFGYEQVYFLGSNVQEVGPYNLNEPLPVLKAPNVISR
ncbi:hypothetical protein [Bacillus sp. Marseille-Q3570]|uniref:hypothetical protein n=1 Tax=Bacillus sp. Marseille-Q3570 TaxID=2963522 RepID=UPI0021B78D00|nr:hypothetical protein [Bacillus sp. Marseille-Q3570]